MDRLDVPTILILLWDIKRAIETQKSIQTGINQFLGRKITDDFTRGLTSALNILDNSENKTMSPPKFNIYQNAMVNLVKNGLAGHGIYQSVLRLEKEIIEICEDDIEKHTQMLPLKLQIPLLGLVFPSLMVILLVPVINMLSL